VDANAQGRPRVVVLGAGFAGLTFCQAFSCPEADVIVVDRQNHHLFQPLLYQVATAGLSAPEIAQPIRSILRQRRNATVLLRRVLKRDFRRIDPQQAHIILLEAGPRLLPQFSARLSSKAAAQLAALGVEVRASSSVAALGEGLVKLADGSQIQSANIIWAAGVAANPLTRRLGVELDRAGRVRVHQDLSLPTHPEAFAIGDLALVLDQRGRPVPGISPAAMQMARHVARLIRDDVRGKHTTRNARPAFRYRNQGAMATIGRSAAVAQIGGLEFSGWVAWVAWLLVHLVFLIGFRNKAAVLLQWTYSYFTYKLGSRIVTGLGDDSGHEDSAR